MASSNPEVARRWAKRSRARATNPVETGVPSRDAISIAVRSIGTLPLASQQDRRGIDVRPVGHGADRPERWRRGGGLPAATAPPRQQVVHLLQHDRQDVPHLRPAHPRVRRIAQVPATARTLTRQGQCSGPVRHDRR